MPRLSLDVRGDNIGIIALVAQYAGKRFGILLLRRRSDLNGPLMSRFRFIRSFNRLGDRRTGSVLRLAGSRQRISRRALCSWRFRRLELFDPYGRSTTRWW